jgi:L-asparagine transporter-like permease
MSYFSFSASLARNTPSLARSVPMRAALLTTHSVLLLLGITASLLPSSCHLADTPMTGFNDAVSVASDLTAAQLVLSYWTESHLWLMSLLFRGFLVSVNASHVRAYGELEYWLSSLKIVTVVIFIITGVFVNLGVNKGHSFIGLKYWKIEGAPFVGGFGGFAKVFVTASFACSCIKL